MTVAWLIPLAVVGIVALIFFLSWRSEQKRTEALREVAEEMSFGFLPRDDGGTLLSAAGFELFSRGRSQKAYNLLRGRARETEVSIFDYRYTTGSGKNSSTHTQTVVCFECGDLRLPRFALQPENLFHKLLGVLGFQDINFGDFPLFSRRYHLQGEHEPAVRRLFDADVVAHFEQLDGISVEGSGRRLLFHRAGKRAAPGEVRKLLEEAFGVYAVLKAACGTEVESAPIQ